MTILYLLIAGILWYPLYTFLSEEFDILTQGSAVIYATLLSLGWIGALVGFFIVGKLVEFFSFHFVPMVASIHYWLEEKIDK